MCSTVPVRLKTGRDIRPGLHLKERKSIRREIGDFGHAPRIIAQIGARDLERLANGVDRRRPAEALDAARAISVLSTSIDGRDATQRRRFWMFICCLGLSDAKRRLDMRFSRMTLASAAIIFDISVRIIYQTSVGGT